MIRFIACYLGDWQWSKCGRYRTVRVNFKTSEAKHETIGATTLPYDAKVRETEGQYSWLVSYDNTAK
jgi:hypothetical protein